MNKLATATATAIVGLAFAMPASAEITASGFFNQDIGFGSWESGNTVESEGNVHMDSDAEIHFKASGTTDGGVSVSVKIELEANPGAGSNSVDEGAITFSGGFGSVTLGNEDPAALSHGYVGIGGGYGGMGYYDSGDTYTPAAVSDFPYFYGDSQKVIYSFPSMGGLSLGVSFAPDTNGDSRSTSNANANGEVSVGASYSADLGGTSVSIGGGMISSTDGDPAMPGGETEKIKGTSGAGVSVGFGDTTIHLRTDRNSETDQRGLGFGIDHSLGALGIGLGYGIQSDADDDDTSALVAGVSYSLGGGVNISAAVARGSVEALGKSLGEDKMPGGTGADADVAGEDTSAVGLGLRLGFSF